MDEKKAAEEAAAADAGTGADESGQDEAGAEGYEDVNDESGTGGDEGGTGDSENSDDGDDNPDFDEDKYRKLIAEGKGENALGELKRLAARAAKAKTKEPDGDGSGRRSKPGEQPQYIKDFKDALKEQGLDGLSDKFLRTVANLAEDIAENKVSGMRGDISERQLEKAIEKLGTKKEYKAAVTRYSKELDKAMRTYPVQYWGDPELVEAELGKIALRNMSKGTSTKPAPVTKISESGAASRGMTSSSGGVKTTEIEAYANAKGWDSKNPEIRNNIIRVLKLKKSTEDRINGKT